jgi:outer membrane protein assembly factor BamB
MAYLWPLRHRSRDSRFRGTVSSKQPAWRWNARLRRARWLAIPLLVAGLIEGALGVDSGEVRGSAAVLEHHGDARRSGMFVMPDLTLDRARQLHRDPAFHADIAGPVYAQPLYWRVPGNNQALLLVATEQNFVYALDATTGRVVWKTSLGSAVPRTTLPCGNINPLGITGTPVIDGHTQTLYVGALVGAERAAKHQIFAVALKDGAILPGWPIDVEAALKHSGKQFQSTVQNQRGALTILDHTLYVPYAGHFGDCGDYRGWVLGVSLLPPHGVQAWSTRARGGGIWAPGGLVSDGSSLYAVTGNTFGARTWADGEAVIRFGPGPLFADDPRNFFAPSDWQALDATDSDLGATNALLLHLPGAQPAELVLALGKDGKAYLLDRRNLGGIGASVLTKKVTSDPIRAAPAAFSVGDEVWVTFQGHGIGCPQNTAGDLVALAITAGAPPAMRTAWCAVENGRGSPIVTTTDGKSNPIVWAVGAEGDNRLHGFRADTGTVVFAGGGPGDAMGEVRRFQTPIAADGRLYVVGDEQVYAFVF